MTSCQHIAALPPEPAPSTTAGCEDCLEAGTSWVHLRECLSCGKVSCCDSSPQRHASKHFGASEHPVIRSFQPGEDWRWCFVDQAIV